MRCVNCRRKINQKEWNPSLEENPEEPFYYHTKKFYRIPYDTPEGRDAPGVCRNGKGLAHPTRKFIRVSTRRVSDRDIRERLSMYFETRIARKQKTWFENICWDLKIAPARIIDAWQGRDLERRRLRRKRLNSRRSTA